jgi:hypothetical protein
VFNVQLRLGHDLVAVLLHPPDDVLREPRVAHEVVNVEPVREPVRPLEHEYFRGHAGVAQ